MSRTEPSTNPLSPPAGVPSYTASLEPATRFYSDRFLIRDIHWEAYRKIADALGEHHSYRLSYDGKHLELMTKSMGHGGYGVLVSFMVQILTEELGLPLCSCGDMTCEREAVARAIEPDQCYYIEHEPLVRSKDKVDLDVDPPPDLALEIDLTTDTRRRMDIYAAIRIPEIWRYDGRTQTVTIHTLQGNGQYALVERSRALPVVGAQDLTLFLHRRKTEEINQLLKSFREWVRQQISKPQ